MIDGASHNRDENWNLLRQFLIRVARKAHLWRAELNAQISLLKIMRLQLFGEKKIDSHSRVWFSQHLGELLLHGVRGSERRITEVQAGDLKRRALGVEFLYIAFAKRIRDKLVIEGDI